MKPEKLEQSYKHLLVKAGVDFHKAEQAAKILTKEELQLISDIWPAWGIAFSQADESRALRDSV